MADHIANKAKNVNNHNLHSRGTNFDDSFPFLSQLTVDGRIGRNGVNAIRRNADGEYSEDFATASKYSRLSPISLFGYQFG